MPAIAARLAAAVGGVVFALLLLEAGLRAIPALDRRSGGDLTERLQRSEQATAIADKPLGLGGLIRASRNREIVYELKPNLRGRFQKRPLSINAHGMRDVEREVEKPNGTFRIAGIGDSIMFGWGVAQEDSYLAVVERRLNQHGRGGHFEALNFACPGYNTHMEVALFEDRVLAFAPDLIVVHFVKNDFDVPHFLLEAPDPWSLDRSYLLEFARGGFHGDLVGVVELGGFGRKRQSTILAPYRHMAGETAVRKAMGTLAARAKELGVPVVVTFGAASAAQRLLLEEMTATHGFVLAPLSSHAEAYFTAQGIAGDREARRLAIRVAPHDPHPNPIGHGLYADALLAALTPILLDRQPPAGTAPRS